MLGRGLDAAQLCEGERKRTSIQVPRNAVED